MKRFCRSRRSLSLVKLLALVCTIALPSSSFTFLAHAKEPEPIPPPPGLVSWWPGDGNFQDIRDSNNGTPVGGVTFGEGEVEQAFLLNGTDAVDGGNASNLHVSSGDFSVDAWVKFNSLAGDMSIIDKMSSNGTVNSDGWRLFKQADNHFYFCLGTTNNSNGCVANNSNTVRSSTVASVGTWFHVAAVKSNSGIAIYVNGVQEDSKSLPPFLDTNSTDLLIGANIREGAHLNGLVDEVQIFNRALSGSEIQAIFNADGEGQIKSRRRCDEGENASTTCDDHEGVGGDKG